MANSKFSYVRNFEKDDKLPSQQWIVISLVNLPNDWCKLFLKNANSRDNYTDLMRSASLSVMNQFKDIKVAYVNFNKIHFVLAKDSTLYQRRSNKLLTYFGSCLTSSFERSWPKHFTEDHQGIAFFDGRIYLFPNDQLFRDFFTKLQLSHHCNNLKHTLHLAIQEQKQNTSAVSLDGVDSASSGLNKAIAAPTTMKEVPENEKEGYYNEVLFSHFGINYNNEPEMYKKGFVLLRQRVLIASNGDANESISDVVENGTDFMSGQGDKEASSDTKSALGPLVGKRAEIRRRLKDKEATIAGKTISEVAFLSPDFKLNSFWLESALINDTTSFNFKCTGLETYAVGEWLLPHAWIVVRIDGKAFHKLSKDHNFDKPNDLRAINLMNMAAAEVMKKMPDIIFGFGESDEYSFVVNRYSKQSGRYSTSLVSQCVSLFTSAYVSNWPKYFDADELKYDPMFDGRAVLYPTNTSLRDYLSWRQADCHINNMYNTVFWKLIQLKNLTNRESEELLRGSFSADKRRFLLDVGIDYDLEPAIHRKGSILYRVQDGEESFSRDLSLASNGSNIEKPKSCSKTTGSFEKPWWNFDCEEVKIQRKSVRKKCQLQPTLQNFEELKACEALAKKVFKTAKQNFTRLSNGSNSDPLVKSASCSKCGSSDLMLSTVLDCSNDVNHTSTTITPNTAASNMQHEESASDTVLNGESGGACIPKGFDKRGNPWWNVECHMAKVARTAAKSAFMRSPSATTDKCFRESELHLKAAIKAAKKDYKRLPDPSGPMVSTGSNKPPANFLQIGTNEVTLDCSRVINLDKENVNGFNGPSNDYKIEFDMLASTLCEGLSATPSMPTDGLADLYNFANSSSQLEACADASKEFDVRTDEYIKFTSVCDGSTDLTGARKVALDGTSDVVKSEDNGFLFGDVIVADSGYNSSSLKLESTQECNDQVAQSISVGGGYKKAIGCDEYKMMGGNICLCHVDIIKDDFWNRNPHILGQEKSTLNFEEDC